MVCPHRVVHSRTARHEWLDQYIIKSIKEAQHFAAQWLILCLILLLRYEGATIRHTIYGGQWRLTWL